MDITHTSEPGLGSGGVRQDLYNRAAQTALNPGPSFDEWNSARTGGGAATGAGRAKPPAGMRYNARGQLKPIRNPGGGGTAQQGGGGGAAAPAFNGVSAQTNTVRDAMIRQAQEGNPLYGTSQGYVGDTLEGNDRNAYRSETFDALRGVDDPDLARLKQYLFSQLEDPNAGGFGGGGGNRTYYVNGDYATSGPGAAGANGAGGPVGAAGYIKKMLDEGYGDNPYLDQSIQDALDDSQRAFNRDVIPGLNSEYAGSGRFGGGMYAQALARAGEEQIRGLAKESNTRRAADYNDWQARRMQALGYGTEMDINAADNAAALASRGGGGGGGGPDRQTLALQRQGMLLDALSGAVDQGVGLKRFGLGGMGDLAKSFSSDQQFSLGATPDVTGLSLRDWGAAGGLSLGADQNQAQYDIGLRDAAARNRANGIAAGQLGLARQQFNFDVFRDERGYPLQSLGGAADIVNAMTGGYGTTTERGVDRRAQSPYMGDTAGQTMSGALGGALLGAQLYGAYGNRGGGGTGGVTLAPGSANGQGGYYLNFGG